MKGQFKVVGRYDLNTQPEPDEETLKKAFGYDDAQLLREFEEAEKGADLNLPIPESGFEEVMRRLREDDDSGRDNGSGGLRGKGLNRCLTRRVARSLLVAAILCTLMMAWGINAVGKKSYDYKGFTGGNPAGRMVWNNDDNLVVLGSLDEAYQQIKEVMGKSAMRLDYVPKGTELLGYDIDERHASISFIYGNKNIEFNQTKYDVGNSNSIVSDRRYYKAVYNDTLGKDINIEKAELPNGDIEYSMEYSDKDCHYYLFAQIDGELFEEIVKGMSTY